MKYLLCSWGKSIGVPAFVFLVFTIISCSSGTEAPPPSTTPTPVTPVTPTPPPVRTDFSGTIRDLTSFELLDEMGVGWNLGNSFDVISSDKTAWGNPLPTSGQISLVKQMGFGTLRIPITWGFNQSEFFPYTIESAYLDRVQEVINLGLQQQMHVIINIHHDDDWLRPTLDDAEVATDRLASLWTQVAERFQSYGDSLIFESINEPRLVGSPEEWTGGTEEGRSVLNGFHQTSVDAIRGTGGNNERRHIMISTYAASTVPEAMDALVIPNDDPNIFISLHSYFPWEFAGLEGGTSEWGSETDRSALAAELDKIREKWIVQENRPVVLGEWGTINKNNVEERLEYVQYYASEAAERGLLTIVWDDGGNFGMLDRSGLVWRFPQLARGIVESSQ